MDVPSLRRISEKLEDPRETVGQDPIDNLDISEERFTVKKLSSSTAHYSGEFSHWNFSQRVQQRIDQRSTCDDAEMPMKPRLELKRALTSRGYWRASQLHLPGPTAQNALACLPPRPIAEFLIRIFLRVGQSNHFFAQEEWLFRKMHDFYDKTFVVSKDDTPTLCTFLMVLAIGTQFAHLDQATPKDSGMTKQQDRTAEESPQGGIGVCFYHEACKLIPDITIIASVESAQAFLLLAAYTLPLDAQGLGYTYLGLSVKMCVQNGMHRKLSGSDLDAKSTELQRRLWWSAYALDKRISILHGRPATVLQSDVDAEFPVDVPEFQTCFGPNKYQNLSAIIQLTNYLEDISHAINLLRRCPKTLQSEYISRLLGLKEKMGRWWQSLPEEVVYNKFTPTHPLFRPNVHLMMSYHLNQIYMGRPFLFHRQRTIACNSMQAARTSRPWVSLAEDCVNGALAIVKLCESLRGSVGLAGSSYTEFSSCRAALLAIIAEALNEQSCELQDTLTNGMDMIKEMMVGNDSAKAEVAVLEALAIAAKPLNSAEGTTPGDHMDQVIEPNYSSFRTWATSLKKSASEGPTQKAGSETDSGLPTVDPTLSLMDLGLNEILSSSPIEFGGLDMFPSLW
ncbi:hypothetical protein AAFC00_005023 [Neodothiora populina]